MKKIVTSNAALYNRPHILPKVGTVNVDGKGEVDVPDDVADMLVTGTQTWKYSDVAGDKVRLKAAAAEAKKKAAAKTEPEPEEELTEEDETELEGETAKIRGLMESELTISGMVDIANAAELPEDKVKKMSKNKTLMINYLIQELGVEKIKAAMEIE